MKELSIDMPARLKETNKGWMPQLPLGLKKQEEARYDEALDIHTSYSLITCRYLPVVEPKQGAELN